MLAIDRRTFLGASAAAIVKPARPNVIVILTDDQGWSSTSVRMHPDISASTCDYLETPNIARLAREGMRFSSGYSPAPVCTPSRRSIQFGMTPARQRGTEFVGDFRPHGHLSIPQALSRADARYRCAHFGKWGESISGPQGLHPDNEANPTALGYHETDGVTGNVTGGMGDDRHDKTEPVANHDPKLIFSMTSRAASFMERQVHESRPFYLQVSYYAVHRQLQCLRETLDKYKRKGKPPRSFDYAFAAMMENLDTGIGQLLGAVDKLGIAPNTYIFFMSDNGGTPYPELKSDGLPINHPLREGKQTLWEGGIRVPFIVRGPQVARGSWSHVPVAGYDILPTVYDLAGGKPPLPGTIDGGSMKALLHGSGQGSVRRGLPGLVFHRPKISSPVNRLSALRIGDWKLVHKWSTGTRELYDLSADIGEQRDRAPEMPGKADEMHRVLMTYLKSVNAEAPPEDARGRGKGGKKRRE